MLESSAICLYLTHEFSGKNGHPQLIPEDDRIADFYEYVVLCCMLIYLVFLWKRVFRLRAHFKFNQNVFSQHNQCIRNF